MAEVCNICTGSYHIPPEHVISNRRMFYAAHKSTAEPNVTFLSRIRVFIESCDFGALADFLLIDKLICEFSEEDIHKLRNVHAWPFNHLLETIENQQYSSEDPHLVAETEFHEFGCDFENDAPFPDPQTSDSEDDQTILDITSETEKVFTEDEDSLNTETTKAIVVAPLKTHAKQNDIQGFTIDDKNHIHCMDCGKKFSHRYAYNKHSRLHTGKDLFSCTICNKVFLTQSYLRNHLRSHEREHRVDGKTFECHLCKYNFLAMHGLRMHINVKHVSGIKNSFQCKICNEVFIKQDILDDHLRSKHKVSVPHKCPHCGRKFPELSALKEHLSIHSEAKPFMCEVCGNAFKTKKQLDMHMARHTNERKYKCGECGLMLKSRSNYKNHMRQHTGERPFECNQCDKTFVQRANYLKHLRWHSGERPHGCTYCEKRFPTAYDMKLHVNSIHTGDKPFSCEMCDRSFAQPSTLRVHRLRVHK